MIKWDQLLNVDTQVTKEFAVGNISGRKFYSAFKGTENGGVARMMLRKHGVTYARRLARKALRRRNLV